ncbi:MAG: diacylglycerol kinase family protein [Chitinophagaceae bacterium]
MKQVWFKKSQPFSLHERGKSFGYAFNGIKAFFRTEHNALLHLLATIVVVILAVVFPVTTTEAAVLALSVGFVWAAELFNTAIEKIMDFISVEKQPQIKYIKDLSAAAVLVTAVAAAAAGLIVFIPKIFL